jgi:hypothetical protein
LLSTSPKRPAAAFSRQGFISPKIDWVSPIDVWLSLAHSNQKCSSRLAAEIPYTTASLCCMWCTFLPPQKNSSYVWITMARNSLHKHAFSWLLVVHEVSIISLTMT